MKDGNIEDVNITLPLLIKLLGYGDRVEKTADPSSAGFDARTFKNRIPPEEGNPFRDIRFVKEKVYRAVANSDLEALVHHYEKSVEDYQEWLAPLAVDLNKYGIKAQVKTNVYRDKTRDRTKAHDEVYLSISATEGEVVAALKKAIKDKKESLVQASVDAIKPYIRYADNRDAAGIASSISRDIRSEILQHHGNATVNMISNSASSYSIAEEN